MTWVLLFVLVFVFFLGLWKMLDLMYEKAAAVRAEKRAKEHFRETERFRRGIW